MRILKWIKRNALGASIAFTYVIEFLILLFFRFNFSEASVYLLLGLIIGMTPYFLYTYFKYKRLREMEEIFPEFLRALAESVRSGVTLPQAIINAANVDYGVLTPEIKKMAAQLSWGIPLPKVLAMFAERVRDSPFLRRSVAIISQAYLSGGNIADAMEKVAETASLIRRLHSERRSKFFQQVLVVYAIFVIFLAMIIALNKIILPIYTFSRITASSGVEEILPFSPTITEKDFRDLFLHMIIIQAIFTGLIVGVILEGKIPAGIKHSALLLLVGLLVYLIFLPAPSLVVVLPKLFDFAKAGSPYTVAGMVITQDKVPVKNAEVLIEIEGYEEVYKTVTDAFGNFRQTIYLPPEKGDYRIKITARSGKSKGTSWLEVTAS